jgi:chromosome segregation ATPase
MDKILQALAGLQQTVEKQGKSIEALHEGQKTLQASVERQGKQLTALQDTVENQSKAIAALQERQKALQAGQQTLELKVEAFHAEQKQANDEIIQIFHNIEGINQKEIEKRVERIERHLNLPPLK